MFKKMDVAGTQGIIGTPQNSGFLAGVTMQWKSWTMEKAAIAQIISMRVF